MDWVTTSTILRDLDHDRDGAWSRFVGHFQRPLVALGMRMGLGRCDAEDAAQETLVHFVGAYRAGRYDRRRGRLSSWLLGFATRTILHARRRAQARAHPSADDAAIESVETDDDKRWDRTWEAALLAATLDAVEREVEPATWRAFELVVLQGVPAAEAARELGMALTAVYNAKHRVVGRLRERRQAVDADDGGLCPQARPGAT